MGDFNGNNYKDDFIGDLVNFVASDKFQTMFEKYFLQHALEFTNEEEHKLKYYELYQEFHDMFETQLSSFCYQKQLTQAEFMKRCREATTDDPKAKHYINVLMSSVEYETFVKLMKIMRPVAEQRLFLQSMANDAKAEEKMSAGEKDAFKDMHDNQDYDIDAKSSYNKADAKEAVSENDDVKASK